MWTVTTHVIYRPIRHQSGVVDLPRLLQCWHYHSCRLGRTSDQLQPGTFNSLWKPGHQSLWLEESRGKQALWVFRCALNPAPHSAAFWCMRTQFWANRLRSMTKAGVLKLSIDLPANALTNSSFWTGPWYVIVWRGEDAIRVPDFDALHLLEFLL